MQSRIKSPDVSAQHLAIIWSGQSWIARDLASRNGTLLDGAPLTPGADAILKTGSVLELGSEEARVVLLDDRPPTVTARCSDVELEGEDDLLMLPSAADPSAVVMLDDQDGWVCSISDRIEEVEDGQELLVGTQRWRLSLPDTISRTENLAVEQASPVRIGFQVSSDEEYVEVTLRSGEQTLLLPPRAHHYLLLTLARARKEDAETGGWLYTDQLRDMLRISSNQFYVSVHRMKREFDKTGLVSGDALIERRKTSRQIRIGLSEIHIAQA